MCECVSGIYHGYDMERIEMKIKNDSLTQILLLKSLKNASKEKVENSLSCVYCFLCLLVLRTQPEGS